ncbi:hypothetical protein TRFO_02360 [Tritrichomonas foetus]|uniref:Uncharacterized protein n=1 Tax=Tritrichomonas foetus TaxID=1144522 RepID=A0A1J4J337_9EUKA|nr:hypothetical protein TRFO_02360 [Tritrichomonas foetus]|eukprot:OHS93838.1 hypothetical protein TRFO_02360 [Tritrichomonas foetus]
MYPGNYQQYQYPGYQAQPYPYAQYAPQAAPGYAGYAPPVNPMYKPPQYNMPNSNPNMQMPVNNQPARSQANPMMPAAPLRGTLPANSQFAQPQRQSTQYGIPTPTQTPPASNPASTPSQPNPPAYPQVQNIVKYKIPHGKEASYANMYSLICTIEELESQFCDGNLSNEDHVRLLKQFIEQFSTIQKALNLSNNDVDNFARSFNMQYSYAQTALFNPANQFVDETSGNNNHVQEAVNLGSDFTTLQDCCILGEVPASEFQDLIRKIRSRLQTINVYQRNQEVREYTDKWINAFNCYKGTDIVPQNVKDDLRTDIQPWRNTAIDALQ